MKLRDLTYLGEGRTRIVFTLPGGQWVLKVPLCDEGVTDNDYESGLPGIPEGPNPYPGGQVPDDPRYLPTRDGTVGPAYPTASPVGRLR